MSSPPQVSLPAVPQSAWRRLLGHPLFLGTLLLLPIVWMLVPVPIDETRYLAVAWEMRQTGEFLVPHLNGATYSHKPPLLFWLINLGWLFTGVHAWTARAMVLLCSIASLLLLQRLTVRLGGSEQAARNAMWLLLGSIYFAAFANAIMFDVLLTTCVLFAAHGLVDLAESHARRGIPRTGLAIGLGILVKGPVILLFVAILAAGAPWWSDRLAAGQRLRFFGRFALAFLLGAAIGLAWAVPAAIHGGEEYARAIFLSQTFDRIEGVAGKSTHGRPWWWYGMVYPLMLLPWTLAIRGRWSGLRALAGAPAVRLALAWVLPTFVAFSFIGGKQPHYLLPTIPGVALGLAYALDCGALRVRSGLFALFLLLLGVAFAIAPYWADTRAHLGYIGDASPVWGAAFVLLGALLLVFARRARAPMWPALAMLAVALLVKLAVIEGPGQRYDLEAAGARIAEAQRRGQPVAHLGWHHGVYEFAGRLTQPLPAFLTLAEFEAWAKEHPDGLVMSFYRQFRFRAEPVFTQPFRGGEVSIWKVGDALASGVDPNVAHARDAEEDVSDE
ncbi:glycosyltransferase family 39 protein [Dokdonella sp.]|uniref:ArnT family glycosyltransferase n=1 Tax=Dokdonella sp. TaxID=2291710 RepID=UPI0026185AC7|nr:glycosyltransferase family 39 protein [Dokdonella sp.]